MIKRTACVVCDCREPMEHVYSFDSFPVYVGVRTSNLPYIFEKMEWGACVNCGCVQLQNLVDLNVLYQSPHNPAIGKTWNSHNIAFSKYVSNSGAKKILDIGGANLNIANLVCASDHVESYTVVDPSNHPNHQNKKTQIIQDMIENVETEERYDGIILSHTLEHIYEPVVLLKRLHHLLNNSGVVFVSVPNIKEQLQDGFLNALNFEHSYFISHEYMKLIAAFSGFEVVDVFDFSKHNSFYTLRKSNAVITVDDLVSDVNQARKVYSNHIENLIRDVNRINQEIANKQVYCFGAHIFSQMLIAAGLNVDRIHGFLDNDPAKTGKCLYGTNITVYNPSVLQNIPSPIVILRVAQYRQEILDGLVTHNPSTNIV